MDFRVEAVGKSLNRVVLHLLDIESCRSQSLSSEETVVVTVDSAEESLDFLDSSGELVEVHGTHTEVERFVRFSSEVSLLESGALSSESQLDNIKRRLGVLSALVNHFLHVGSSEPNDLSSDLE